MNCYVCAGHGMTAAAVPCAGNVESGSVWSIWPRLRPTMWVA